MVTIILEHMISPTRILLRQPIYEILQLGLAEGCLAEVQFPVERVLRGFGLYCDQAGHERVAVDHAEAVLQVAIVMGWGT